MNYQKIEKKWQKKWEKSRIFEAEPNNKEKFFVIFAYPGVSGYLHIGHMRGYTYTDAIARYKRMAGFNVLFPVGTHATGNVAIGFARKVKKNEHAWIDYLINNGCPKEKIKSLEEPLSVVHFFNKVYVEDYWKRFGFSADFRRFTTTINPDYGKFIEWQFKKLNNLGLLIQKPYFAPACVECGPVAVDPSETDLSKGGNAEKQEFTILKFKFKDKFLIAATLRPETVFGQTNLWIRDDVEYVISSVENEKWIISKECLEKLTYQGKKTKVLEKIFGRELIGKKAIAPMIHRELIILPSTFVEPNIGTGIVTSVPSDAPYDYIALMDLKKDDSLLAKFGLNKNEVESIKPISIIKSEELGNMPAEEICRIMEIKSQKDKEKLETATKEVYSLGFHTGIMNQNCSKYSGMKVEIAKEKVKEEMIKSKEADVMYDLSEEVICRCGGKVVIKLVPDQWFIKYSDEKLTKESIEWGKKMNIYPEDYYVNLPDVLKWFSDRTCVRLGSWLGTKFPFDDKWTIEAISDSTLYPIYYLVSKYVNEKKLKVSDLNEAFFDYVFLSKKTGEISVKKILLEQIKKDVDYWYPLDINLGGKEHKTVHFPPFIMNHTAILPKKFWAKGIFVNWWVLGKGKNKISKSKGGAEPIGECALKYSVDGMRLYYAHIGSAHTDIEWDNEIVFKYKNHAENFFSLGEKIAKQKEKKANDIDKWLISRANSKINEVRKYMDEFSFKKALDVGFFPLLEDFKWCILRGGKNQKKAFEILLKFIAPIMPHTAEELWEKLGNKTFISLEKFPVYDEKLNNTVLEAGEELVNKICNDTMQIIKIINKKPKEIRIILSPLWKYSVYSKLIKVVKKERDIKKIMFSLPQKIIKEKGKEIAGIIQRFIKEPSKIPSFIIENDDEVKAVKSSLKFIEKKFGCKVKIENAGKSKNPKAGMAEPFKPAIVIN